MLKIIRAVRKDCVLIRSCEQYRIGARTFLSQAYYCNEVWEYRLRSPIIKKVRLEELYQNLEQRFNKTRTMSAVDVDIFANAVTDETYIDELLDLIHKLRLSADTGNTLNSTSHAVIRYLTSHGRDKELLSALDDRLNYGLFLDHFTANILMDTYYKSKDFLSGARVASQLMYQEDFSHPVSTYLALLHCYNFLLNPTGWPEQPKPEEPEDEVKIRVRYLRNPYYDDHFDIKDPLKIVGKTVWMATKELKDTLDKSLHLVGLGLHEKSERALTIIENLHKNSEKMYGQVLAVLPEGNEVRKEAMKLQNESGDVQSLLEDKVRQAERHNAEKDVATQCELYANWEEERKQALQRQVERLLINKRLANIEDTQKELKERETKLWFFENEEHIEMEILAKQDSVEQPTKTVAKDSKSKTVDEAYIPPEV